MNGSQAKRAGARVQKLISHARQRAKTTQHKREVTDMQSSLRSGYKEAEPSPNNALQTHCNGEASAK